MTSFYYYPESFRVLLPYENYGFCNLNLTGISKFKYERKNEMNSGPSSKKSVIVQMAHFSGFLADKKFEFTVNLVVAEIV